MSARQQLEWYGLFGWGMSDGQLGTATSACLSGVILTAV